MGDLFTQFDVWGAIWLTIYLTVASAIGSLVLGTIIAVMRVGPVRIFNLAGSAYVNTFRNTPLTLIIVFTLLGLWSVLQIDMASPDSSTYIRDNAVRWAIIGLSIYHASFVCEALRSGINTVPAGQAEAARSIGLTFTQSLRFVVLPQAFRGAIAPLGSVLIALTKNTTVASAIGVAELAGFMKDAIEIRTDLNTLIFALVAGIFVVLTLPVGFLFTHLSRRLAVKR